MWRLRSLQNTGGGEVQLSEYTVKSAKNPFQVVKGGKKLRTKFLRAGKRRERGVEEEASKMCDVCSRCVSV